MFLSSDPGNTLTAEGIFTSADRTLVNPAVSDEITGRPKMTKNNARIQNFYKYY